IANQFGRIIVGQNGLLSTPAISHLIPKYQAFGGLILSASHNPGGSDGDFGIKYNIETGAPSPQSLADKISKRTLEIDRYWQVDVPDIDIATLHETYVGTTQIQIIDPVADYAAYMQEIFDFKAISALFKKGLRMVFDAMHAVTGPYAIRIFEEMLGAKKGSVINGIPKPDFGGHHPDPNLTYAKSLVDLMSGENAPDIGAASDGDGDRHMILGRGCFILPSDELAVFTQHIDKIDFYNGKMYGVARSMPTAMAADYVAYERKLPVFETPTGWKFFGSLLDAKKITICGEESFGSGSFHIREKDGIWAILVWLNIMALTKNTPQGLVEELWHEHGRVFNTKHMYEEIDPAKAQKLIDQLRASLPELIEKSYGGYTVKQAYDFAYTDPVSGEVVEKQGVSIVFGNNARIVVRLSGTSASGATVLFYINKLVSAKKQLHADVQETLADLIQISKEITHLEEITNRKTPTVIT
ncbi:MAG: alpha-D-glucose phosphate-specific phosphoglucomutase, partial [Lactobacillales bacterium]|nr:alpha-D-glucose phosphate-specific phosphoglucomutase [Lactobacillales bacterium]